MVEIALADLNTRLLRLSAPLSMVKLDFSFFEGYVPVARTASIKSTVLYLLPCLS